MTTNRSGIYIHIPFCVRKCPYCAFLSAPSTADERDNYVNWLCREISIRGGEAGVCDSIFLGGGTPSLLTPAQIEKILDMVFKENEVTADAEITLEANPATLTEYSLKEYRKIGCNRLSMGVQSMNPKILSRLGRIHSAEDVYRDNDAARKAGFENISMDLMFAIPGSTREDVRDDVEKVISLSPDHISFYSLQLEEGTPFFQQFLDGELKEIPDIIDREMYHQGIEILQKNGYEQYEISNFAKNGKRSFHNEKYWSMQSYLGLGLGASSFTDGKRIVNVCDMKSYENALLKNEKPFAEIHQNTEHDNISEAMFTGLRRVEGISFKEIFGSKKEFEHYYQNVKEELRGFIQSGDLIITKDGMRLTEKGIDISNRIMALFV